MGTTFTEKNKQKKLILIFKIGNNEAPGYLKNLQPNRVGDENVSEYDQEIHYNLRNNKKYEVPYSRLCSYGNSYFPSTLRLWNELVQDTRKSSSVLKLKNRINVRLSINQQTIRYLEIELTNKI